MTMDCYQKGGVLEEESNEDEQQTSLSSEKNPESNKPNVRAQWSRQFEFTLACIGYAVGMGNIWRFPYLCMRNGGGAFLIPYFTGMLLCGMPLFFMELSIGQFASQSPTLVWNLCPLFKGLGWGMVLISGLICTYFNVIITWVLYYLVKSFTLSLPWATCDNWWNTDRCRVRSADNHNNQSDLFNRSADNSNNQSYLSNSTLGNTSQAHMSVGITATNLNWLSPVEEFWQNEMLELSPGIDQPGGIKWQLLVILIFSWILVFLCICKGVKSTGKVVYVTATLPYIFLTILLIRGALLPGAGNGIKYYLVPDWKKLASFKVWAEGFMQVLYSLGPAWGSLITMASYNKFHHNCHRDSLIIPVINCCTSFYGGFVIFSVIGFMAHEVGLEIDDVITAGPGLVFVVYPEAISKMPMSSFWAVCFFTMMLSIGLDTQFCMFETVASTFIDEYPKYLLKRKWLFTAAVCVLECLLGLPFVSRGGMYIFQVIDWYIGAFAIMTIALGECLVISWIYKHQRLYKDIEMMIGYKPGAWWKTCWCFITPAILVTVLVYNCFALGEPYYGNYTYPRWAIGLGWIVGLIPILPLPICFVVELLKQKGTFMERLFAATQPSEKWGPLLPENRLVDGMLSVTINLDNEEAIMNTAESKH